MRIRYLITILIIVLLLPVQVVKAQFIKSVSKVGTTGAVFLGIGIGARPIGMGGAYAGVSDDASGLYWNPGGLGRIAEADVYFNTTNWLADTKLTYFSIALPTRTSGTFGLSFTSLSMADMKVRTIEYPEGTGENFGAGDMALGLSYGRNLTDRFSIGFTAKYINQYIWHMNASSIAFDIGTLFTTQFYGARIGMSISNFGNKMMLSGKDTQILYDIDEENTGNNEKIFAHLDTDRWSLPLTLRIGLAVEAIDTKSTRLTIATDAVSPNNYTESLNLGFEYAFYECVFLRMGYKSMVQDRAEEELTLGGGLSYTLGRNVKLYIDYTCADFGALDSVERFDIRITW